MNGELIKLLCWYAGLELDGPSGRSSISEVTWDPNDKADVINTSAAEVIAVLCEINRELNGPRPSEVSDKTQVVPRQLVFAVEEIRRLLRRATAKCSRSLDREALHNAEARITLAWSGILAGDIDDIMEYIVEQFD